MNPFERIEEMRQTLKAEVINNGIKGSDCITQAEHYKRMIGMLNILEEEMKDAEYHYQVESVDNTIRTFEELTVLQKELNDDVIIFQPVVAADEFTAADMQSLADVLTHLRDTGQIKENMILLPPNINVFRAVLAEPSDENSDESD
jgi:hypothetical protein